MDSKPFEVPKVAGRLMRRRSARWWVAAFLLVMTLVQAVIGLAQAIHLN
jgi:hypothetical protein